MLIPLIDLKNKYNLDIRGVIHIGMYNAEELPAYRECGVEKVIWIEALKKLADAAKLKFESDPSQWVIEAVISDKEETVDFMVTNNEASSSILNLGTHLQHHPRVWEEKRIKVVTCTMESIINGYGIDMVDYNFLNIDIQGAELKALKGMKYYLQYIDYLYLEVNEEEIYEKCCLVEELDEFLSYFKRVETKMTKYNWGDAMYIRKTLL
jgi:FkbM family methyltransferase